MCIKRPRVMCPYTSFDLGSRLMNPDSPAINPKPGLDALSDLDHLREAMLARFTWGLSPESLALAWLDWTVHLAGAPGKRLGLALNASKALTAWLTAALAGDRAGASAHPLAPIRRFAAPPWQQWPFHPWAQGFLLCEDWWGPGHPGSTRHAAPP